MTTQNISAIPSLTLNKYGAFVMCNEPTEIKSGLFYYQSTGAEPFEHLVRSLLYEGACEYNL